MYTFADLHCDTITAAYERKQNFFKNNLHIDIERLNNFKSPIQVFAIWLSKKYYKNSFYMTNKMIDFFEEQVKEYNQFISKVKCFDDIHKSDKINAMLSIEGGESIENNIENLYHFFDRGVRILTLCWNYENNIGFGAFTKSKEGLKPFGKDVVKAMNSINMVIDASHLNEEGFWDLYKISKKPFIATHSNAYSICNHFRNLKDDQLKAIKDCEGIVGINLYPKFLTNKDNATDEDIFRHIDYMANILGVDRICLGGDFDGIEDTPLNIENISKYSDLFEKIEKIYGKEILDKISYKNFYNFCKKNLKK
ncbi:dipeptidase [uncultured Tyzzerella sp.]|uniref:dipeptidase n=1 Tax=uncultured Tyzzerella sp. TaxID=2321398 RepID=UPI002943B3EC|nr:dipeptidase [uncultured Tyzzerella sp.]